MIVPKHIKIAHIRHIAGESKVQFHFDVFHKHRIMSRDINEPLSKMIARIQLLKQKETYKKSGKTEKKQKINNVHKERISDAKGNVFQNTKVRFLDAQKNIINDTLPLHKAMNMIDEFWIDEYDTPQNKNDEKSEIEKQSCYHVIFNQPRIYNLHISSPCFVGIPIVPSVDKTEFCSFYDNCDFIWYYSSQNASSFASTSNAKHKEQKIDDKSFLKQCLSNSWTYTPTEKDIGHSLQLLCTAPSPFVPSTFISQTSFQDLQQQEEFISSCIEPIPNRSVFHRRLEWIQKSREDMREKTNAFRVISYNILFDRYAKLSSSYISPSSTTDEEVPNNMSSHNRYNCFNEHYRMQLVLKEFMDYDAEIICTQEMGERIFTNYFEPFMKTLGYTCTFSRKAGSTPEGCATFVRDSSFILHDTLNLVSSHQYIEASNEDTAKLKELISFLSPNLEQKILQLPTTSQIQIMEHRATNQIILLVNMHAYFQSKADFIRLIQIAMITNELEQQKLKYPYASILFCGDFNASPGSIAMDYLLNGKVTNDHRHWKAEMKKIKQSKSNGICDDITEKKKKKYQKALLDSFSHSLNFMSGCDMEGFTTFTPEFVNTLDYILYTQDSLHLSSSMPMFDVSDVTPSLPNLIFPSDHISIGCNLCLRS